MNPLGMVVALLGAMNHAATLNAANKADIFRYTGHVQEAMYAAFREERGTRDMCGPTGLITEQFVESVAADLTARLATGEVAVPFVPTPEKKAVCPSRRLMKQLNIDEEAMRAFFDKYDTDGNASICFPEFVEMA